MLSIATAATLLVGYVDLSRGGTTLAPIALVLAYLVLAPAALLAWR